MPLRPVGFWLEKFEKNTRVTRCDIPLDTIRSKPSGSSSLVATACDIKHSDPTADHKVAVCIIRLTVSGAF